MYSVARIGQVQIMYRARLVSEDVAAGLESEEVALVDFADIPWEQLAFPTVVWALAHFHELARQDRLRDLLATRPAISRRCGRRGNRRGCDVFRWGARLQRALQTRKMRTE